VDTNFVPFGEHRLKMILEGVLSEGDKAEVAALGAKSDIDVRQKGLGIAKVAKFILGAANRMPDVAQGHFHGYAVMVLGVQVGSTPGLPSGVEAHELGDRLRAYLGPNGPSWDLARLPADVDREVLFIVVDPPGPGVPPYPCHKDFQPQDKQDAKHALRDGALYVRDKSNTRTARAVEVLALFERGKAVSTPDVAVSLTCDGLAVSVHDASETLEDVVSMQTEQYRKERAELDAQPRESSNPLLRDFNSPLYGRPKPSGPPKPVEEVLKASERRTRSIWDQTIGMLAGAACQPVGFTVLNSAASYLTSPLMIVTIEGAYGVDGENPDDVDLDDVLPSVVPHTKSWHEQMRVSIRHVRPAGHRQELEWRNTDSGMEVRLTPEALRPGTPWSPRDSDLVVIARIAGSNTLRGTWTLTAEGLGEQFTGETSLSVDRDVGVRGLYERYFAARKAATPG